MSFALTGDFFLLVAVCGFDALVFFVVAAIKLRYHPASRGVRGASNRMHGKVIGRWLANRTGRSPCRTDYEDVVR